MEIKIKTLKNTPLVFLYFSFIMAFSDYQVNIKLSYKSFKNLIKTRDVYLSKSFAIFLKKPEKNNKSENKTIKNEIENKKKKIENLQDITDEKIIEYYKTELSRILGKKIKLKKIDIYKIPISFILCGIRKNVDIYIEKEDKILTFGKAAYDSGTGTIPIFRGKGLSKLLINESKNLLRKNNIDGFVLEVLETNEKAKNIYFNAGFLISRRFYCLKINRQKLLENLERIINKETNDIDLSTENIKIKSSSFSLFSADSKKISLDNFLKSPLSWQNSFKSIKNIKKLLKASYLYINNRFCGIGIIQESNSDIKIFSIKTTDKTFNNIKLKEKLEKTYLLQSLFLKELIKLSKNENISILNIDEKMGLKDFLSFSGFNNFVNQFEMYLKIKL